VPTITLDMVLTTIGTGIVATVALDLWALLLHRSLALPMTNWGHVGRWVFGLREAIYRDKPIGATEAVSLERTIGWTTHYVIGAAYACVYLAILAVLAQPPGVRSALSFGLATVLAPWLILQPGLGVGFFASRAARPNLTRTLNVLAHLVFGIGLYLGWRLMSLVD
jgi:hypothetical protein